ncbi:MAG: winged helix-turn-helix domain-containing protein [Methanothrix sp.]
MFSIKSTKGLSVFKSSYSRIFLEGKKEMVRRTRLEVLSSILEICGGEGASKTRIVYQINLNFKNAGAYLNWLTDKGYLVKEGKMYKITPEGKKMLLNLKEICGILNFEEHIAEDKV